MSTGLSVSQADIHDGIHPLRRGDRPRASSAVTERSFTQELKAVPELHPQANCVRQVIIKYRGLAALADFQLASRAWRQKQNLCDRIC